MPDSIQDFDAFRARMNELILGAGNLTEIFSVGLVVGGSIVIPHLRRAMARLEEISEVPPAPA